jgi:hypothetical protein
MNTTTMRLRPRGAAQLASPLTSRHLTRWLGSASATCAVVAALSGCATVGATDGSSDTAPNYAWSLQRDGRASAGDISLTVHDGASWSGDGLELDGGGGQAATAAPGPLKTNASFTVSAWVKPGQDLDPYAAAVSQVGKVAGAFFLGRAEGSWAFSVKPADGNGDDFTTNRDSSVPAPVTPGRWIHLTGVYDAAKGRALLYVNGYPVSADGVSTEPVFAARGALLIGRAQAHGEPADRWSGTISQVALWQRAITAGEVARQAKNGMPDGAVLQPLERAQRPACPNSHGGHCLGPLEAGQHATSVFAPALQYTVPAGWTNLEDLPGNFLLQRESDPQDEVFGGNYVAVYQNIRAAARDCTESPQAGVGKSATELTAELKNRPGVDIVAEGDVAIGGLSGYRLDLRIDPSWADACLEGLDVPAVPLIIGSGVSQFHHSLVPPTTLRLVLLDWHDGNVAIEVSSWNEQNSLDEFLTVVNPIIDSFVFED